MSLYLGSEDVRALASQDVLMDAARAAVQAEREGAVVMPPRLDVDLPTGFLRVMPAAMGEVMGVKVMTLVKGLGNRYLLLLYSQPSGELLALLDADEITHLRTAATTALAGEMLAPDGTSRLGLLGSGFEAESHLRLFARVWPLEQVLVYSPTMERRQAFAARMSEELGVSVVAVDRAEDAVAGAKVSVLATKATAPVVHGSAFPAGAVVLSIGSTRPDLRELDRHTLGRAGALLVDDAKQVRLESGDVIDALGCGALASEHIVSMADVDGDCGRLRAGGARDLLAFKSVGTAVQDLALAKSAFAAAQAQGRGRELGELTSLKAFAVSSGNFPP
ncbi:MAG TPA: ornithine cyclodeaminase family protein, partial [Thermoleophilaceae bacterium]|nr:ornithine cyclodeaminase family protein [Thermoleophilaceae bacterium]